MIHCNTERTLPYPIGPLFEVVADIEAYPLYMPGWRAARILNRTPTRLDVEQTVSLAGLRITFVSVAEADPPHRLDVQSSAPPFHHFRLLWLFTARAAVETLVRAELEVAFRSFVLERLAARMMPIVLNRVIEAFERRAVEALDAVGVDRDGHSAADRSDHPTSSALERAISSEGLADDPKPRQRANSRGQAAIRSTDEPGW